MITTSLGAQYLKAALAKWRTANPWGSDIAWEQIPQRNKDEIEVAARVMMLIGKNSVKQVIEFIPESDGGA
jgi:hypothetical protein